MLRRELADHHRSILDMVQRRLDKLVPAPHAIAAVREAPPSLSAVESPPSARPAALRIIATTSDGSQTAPVVAWQRGGSGGSQEETGRLSDTPIAKRKDRGPRSRWSQRQEGSMVVGAASWAHMLWQRAPDWAGLGE